MNKIRFVGKNSYIETPQKETSHIIEFFKSIQQNYRSTFTNVVTFFEFYKTVFAWAKNPFGIKLEISYDNIYNNMPDRLKKEFIRFKQKIEKNCKDTFQNPDYENLDYYMNSLTDDDSSMWYINIVIYLSPGYYTCPHCEEFGYQGNGKVLNTPLNESSIGDDKLIICPYSHQHGTIYFDDSYLLKNISRWSGRKFDIKAGLKLHKVSQRSKKQKRLAHELCMYAKKEDQSFRSMSYSDDMALYFLTKNSLPIGYAYWNNSGEKRALRQIFILKKHRGGNGTLFLKETAELESNGGPFVIESPNKISIRMLEKLGFLQKIDGKYSNESRCSIITPM